MQDEHNAPFKWNFFFSYFYGCNSKQWKNKNKSLMVKEWSQVLVHVKMSNTLTPAWGMTSSLYTEASEPPRRLQSPQKQVEWNVSSEYFD